MPTGPGAARAFRIATAACKRRGNKSFKKGSAGYICRGALAEEVAAKHRSKR